QACISFLADTTRKLVPKLPRYLVTKTPSVDNLRLISLFQNSKTIVIVRDGRTLVESGVRSFGWDFESGCRHWARAADLIIAAQTESSPFLLVRYEDLVGGLQTEMTRILTYLGLDSSVYDFEAASRLPVRGSSTFGVGEKGVHWHPVEKTAAFDPLHRCSTWC